MGTALLAFNFGMNMVSGALNASANREAARAKMAALQEERNWNLKVMGRNKRDVYASNVLESWGAGIDPSSGSTAAIISQNQRVLQEEIDFTKRQYDMEMRNLEAQSKQKYLGLF